MNDTPSTHVFEHGRGKVTIHAIGPRVSHFIVEGVLDDILADAIMTEGSRISRDGEGVALHDWSRLHSYSSSARAALTEWMMRHRHGFADVRILVGSNIVAMGVRVANLALGGFLHVGTNGGDFAAAVEEQRTRST